MAITQDGLGALITLLKADSTISALIGTRIFGEELPETETVNMPRQCIVIQHAGSRRGNSYIDIKKIRLDFFCYGVTLKEAGEVHRTLESVLRDLERTVTSSTVLYQAEHSAGPFYARNREAAFLTNTNWPMLVDTWLIKMQETIAS